MKQLGFDNVLRTSEATATGQRRRFFSHFFPGRFGAEKTRFVGSYCSMLDRAQRLQVLTVVRFRSTVPSGGRAIYFPFGANLMQLSFEPLRRRDAECSCEQQEDAAQEARWNRRDTKETKDPPNLLAHVGCDECQG
jgi:hypothetical protein